MMSEAEVRLEAIKIAGRTGDDRDRCVHSVLTHAEWLTNFVYHGKFPETSETVAP